MATPASPPLPLILLFTQQHCRVCPAFSVLGSILPQKCFVHNSFPNSQPVLLWFSIDFCSPSPGISSWLSQLAQFYVVGQGQMGLLSDLTGDEPKSFCCRNSVLVAQPSSLGCSLLVSSTSAFQWVRGKKVPATSKLVFSHVRRM